MRRSYPPVTLDNLRLALATGAMARKQHIDLFGVIALSSFSLLLAFNQVVIKVTNGGFQPVFFAGVRSAGAVVCLLLWLRWRGIPLRFEPGTRLAGVITGTVFAVEFLLLFVALDLTTVSRAGILFYSMPVWLALIAHVVLPDDKITARKAVGLALAVAGVAWAFADQSGGQARLLGDLAALGAALGWAITAMMARASSLSRVRPEIQLLWQVGVSAPILLIAAFWFGDLLRDPQAIHYAGLLFQIVVVVSAGFLFWLWLLSIYPASGVASFSFLSPVLSVGLGWLLLGEQVSPRLIAALALVALGIVLINRPKSRKTSV